MIKTFADKDAERLFTDGSCKRISSDVAARTARKLDMIDAALTLEDLRVPPGNRLHALKGDRAGMHAISVNDGFAFASRASMRTMSRCATTIEAGGKMEQHMILMARKPTHPGEVLREEFMPDYGLTVASLAKRLGVSRQSVNEVVRERRAVSTEMAMRLSRLFGTSAEYWLNLQRNVDLWESLDLHREELDAIEALIA